MRRTFLVALLLVFIATEATVQARPLPAEDFRSMPVRETGTVVRVADGDTILFRADGSDDVVRVRLLGINTPEVRGFGGQNFEVDQCGGPQASELLTSVLPPGTPVQLRSATERRDARDRIQRFAFALNPQTGAFDIDPQAIVARAGLAMWFTLRDEAALSATYRRLIDQAQLERLGIWNPEFCGPVEQPDAQMSVIVNWDAPGNDADNVNGESIIVRNIGTTPVDISGWLLRDSSLEGWFTFPEGQIVAPNDYRVVFVGVGVARERFLFMGSATPIFANVSYRPFIGDGAYLLDRATAVRAFFQYPCTVDCDRDPLLRRVAITEANADFIDITNISRRPVLMDGAFLRIGAATYPFLANTTIQPGKRIRVRLAEGRPTRKTQFWGKPWPTPTPNRPIVQLLSARDVEISRVRWAR